MCLTLAYCPSALKEGDLITSPQHSPLFVPDVNPELKPLFCRLQGLGVPASRTPTPLTPCLPCDGTPGADVPDAGLLPLGALPGRRQARRHPDVDVRSDFPEIDIPRPWYKFVNFGVETSRAHQPSFDCSMLANMFWWSHHRF
jgi:hypothetical protein